MWAVMVGQDFLGLPEQFGAGNSRATGLDPEAMRYLAQMNVIVPDHGRLRSAFSTSINGEGPSGVALSRRNVCSRTDSFLPLHASRR
jgi:hypothetical protein